MKNFFSGDYTWQPSEWAFKSNENIWQNDEANVIINAGLKKKADVHNFKAKKLPAVRRK